MANHCKQNNLIAETISSIVSDADNRQLISVPQSVEIKAAVFALNGDGAPGPDGFGGHFYQTYWDVVGADVVQSVQEFFITDVLPDNINNNLIVLIPKVPGPRVMGIIGLLHLLIFNSKSSLKFLQIDWLQLLCGLFLLSSAGSFVIVIYMSVLFLHLRPLMFLTSVNLAVMWL